MLSSRVTERTTSGNTRNEPHGIPENSFEGGRAGTAEVGGADGGDTGAGGAPCGGRGAPAREKRAATARPENEPRQTLPAQRRFSFEGTHEILLHRDGLVLWRRLPKRAPCFFPCSPRSAVGTDQRSPV